MSISDVLDIRCIRVNSQASGKTEVLKEITELAKENQQLRAKAADEIFKALEDREKAGTTGFGDGIAIPHCSFEDIDHFVVGMMTFAGGVAFESVDRKPVFALFFIIGPSRERNRHPDLILYIKNPARKVYPRQH